MKYTRDTHEMLGALAPTDPLTRIEANQKTIDWLLEALNVQEGEDLCYRTVCFHGIEMVTNEIFPDDCVRMGSKLYFLNEKEIKVLDLTPWERPTEEITIMQPFSSMEALPLCYKFRPVELYNI